MKTFKLKSLEIVEVNNDVYKTKQIPLYDGLIINQEDEENNWMIEAFTEGLLFEYFSKIQEKEQQIIVHVKITTEQNEKATCLIQLVDLNKINDKLSVLFIGPMLKSRTEKIEKMLAEYISQGYREAELLERFKDTLS